MSRDPDGRNLKTLTTALDILDFVKQEDDVRLSDVTERFDMAKSTAHGYLSTLEETGLITRTDQHYELGLRLLHFGEHAKERNNLYRIAEPKVTELADRLGEGADFMVEENGRLITVYNNVVSIEDPNFRVGRYFYMHNSAGGKAVLAEFSEERVERIIDKWGLPAVTDKTITDRETLLAELEQVREQGYATTDEELVEGLRSVGVAVNYPDGSVFGALGIGGPTYRLDDTRLHNQIPNVLMEVADELESEVARAIEAPYDRRILPD